jgi:hypothetical protein
MKIRFFPALATLTCLLVPWPIFAQVTFQPPNWDRSMAIEVVSDTDTRATLAPLFRLAREHDDASLLEALSAIRADQSLPDPAADYLLFSFAIGLSDLDAGTVGPEILRFLDSYQVRTRVPHDENPDAGVPLFNVRAATSGVQTAWERQQAASQALGLDDDRPETWIDRYLAASPAGRRGFLEALADLTPEQLQVVGDTAAGRLEQNPELTLVVALAGAGAADSDLIWRSIEQGQPGDLPAVLRAAASQLDTMECAALLIRILGLDSTTAKALGIALLGPASISEAKSQDALFSALESRELGAGAALVLSASSDSQVQQRLNDIAQQQEGLAGQRANLAINLRKAEAGAVQ